MQKDANLVDLEKCCQTHIFLQNFVLIQPRTSPPKICKNLVIFPILLTLTPNPNEARSPPWVISTAPAAELKPLLLADAEDVRPVHVLLVKVTPVRLVHVLEAGFR